MSDFPEDVMKLARETAEAFTWSSTTTDEATAIARAIMQDRDSRAPSANNSGSNGETLEKACRNDPDSDPKNENITAAQSKADAFDKIVAAREAYVDAAAAYNARLEFVRAERDRGNWLNVDPEYAAMSEAQSAFYRTVQELADGALAAQEAE